MSKRPVSESDSLNQIASNMVGIGPGRITLKDEGSGRCWTVDLNRFQISKYVVTQSEYLMLNTGDTVSAEDGAKPVVDVSWDEAVQFCNLVSKRAGLKECYSWKPNGEVICNWDADGYRLPSEAEWEYACRAGNDAVRYGALDDIAWYRENSHRQLQKVGMKKPNDWGLYDTIGNVWEWCWDIYDAEVYGPYRVFRGGGWNDPPRSCRASCRRKSHPSFGIDDLGFRLARSNSCS